MWRLRLRGELNRETYARYKSMLFSGLPIAGLDGTMGTRNQVVQHLRAEVERLMNESPSGGVPFEDMREWFEALSFDSVVTWLVENWQQVARVLAALMVFLQAELEA